MLNKVIIMGRLTEKPELKLTKDETAVTSFSVAVDKPYNKNKPEQTELGDGAQ